MRHIPGVWKCGATGFAPVLSVLLLTLLLLLTLIVVNGVIENFLLYIPHRHQNKCRC